jgi:diguanylate cyclase (GGDEF)-like protein
MSLLLLDFDHFKRVNDTHGHPAGDMVLHEFARRLGDELRIEDIAGRWGGEEFLVILPHTDLEGAVEVAERIRATTAGTPVTAGTARITVTVSGGCCDGPGQSPEELLRRADTGLYQAKAAGRNQIAAARLWAEA